VKQVYATPKSVVVKAAIAAKDPRLSSSAKADDPVAIDARALLCEFGDYWMPAFAGMTVT